MATAKKKPTKKTTQDAIDTEMAKAEEFTAQAPNKDMNLTGDWDIDTWFRASVEIWRPEPGEAVIGTYDGSLEFEGDFDQPCRCHHIIERDTGNRISFVGGVMCDKFIEEAGVEKGYKIFVMYNGKTDTKKGNAVNNFDIRYKA